MSQAAKRFDQMRRNPCADWGISDIQTVCAYYGLTCVPPTSGTHWKVSHPTRTEILTIPAHRPIKPVYIRALVGFINGVLGAA